MSINSYCEYICFGNYKQHSEGCLLGCTETVVCMEATYYIPHASISNLCEYLASPNHSIRSRANARLTELQSNAS